MLAVWPSYVRYDCKGLSRERLVTGITEDCTIHYSWVTRIIARRYTLVPGQLIQYNKTSIGVSVLFPSKNVVADSRVLPLVATLVLQPVDR